MLTSFNTDPEKKNIGFLDSLQGRRNRRARGHVLHHRYTFVSSQCKSAWLSYEVSFISAIGMVSLGSWIKLHPNYYAHHCTFDCCLNGPIRNELELRSLITGRTSPKLMETSLRVCVICPFFSDWNRVNMCQKNCWDLSPCPTLFRRPWIRVLISADYSFFFLNWNK